jgi:predicted solute-binding protein
MSDKISKEHEQELLEMVKEKKKNQSAENVLSVFCQRHGLSLETCRLYYDELVAKGEIKKK